MRNTKTVENLVYNGDKGQKNGTYPQVLSQKQKPQVDNWHTGRLGEDIAVKWLMRHGYWIIDRNYYIKGGEIDIVAMKSGIMHFIEVKSVSRETYDPLNNLTRYKVSHVINAAHYYRKERRRFGAYQIDAITVVLDYRSLKAKISYIENINI